MRRTIYSRVNRQDRLMHVASSQAAVFDSNQSHMNRIDTLKRWRDVYRMGEKQGVFLKLSGLKIQMVHCPGIQVGSAQMN